MPPSQLPADSVATYFYKYVDFIVLRAFIEDNARDLDIPDEMDKFLAGLVHYEALRHDMRDDRLFCDPDRVWQYSQGQIVTTVTAKILSHPRLTNGGVPLLPKLALLPPECGLSPKPSSFHRQRPASVHLVHDKFSHGSAFDIPPDVSPQDQHIADRYTAAVHAIQADPRKFSSCSECAVCEGIPLLIVRSSKILSSSRSIISPTV